VLQFPSNLKQFSGKSQGLSFANSDGKHIDADLFDEDIFAPIRAMATLDSIRFHDLRHCLASMLIAPRAGPILSVQTS
jgi:hypothetical protein